MLLKGTGSQINLISLLAMRLTLLFNLFWHAYKLTASPFLCSLFFLTSVAPIPM